MLPPKPLVPATIALLLLLPACSGRGSSSGSADSPRAQILVDTSNAGDAIVTGRIDVVAVEYPDGTIGPNLLATTSEVVLAHPEGMPSALALRAHPRGAWSAVHALVVPGSVRARLADGREVPVRATDHALRIEPTQPPAALGHGDRLMLFHREPSMLQTSTTGEHTWQPALDVAPVDLIPLRHARVDVVQLAPALLGTVVGLGDLAAELRFDANARLFRGPGGEPLSVADFVAGLEVGSRLLVDGMLDFDLGLTIDFAVDLGRAPKDGRGVKGVATGRIRDVDPVAATFTLGLQDVMIGGHLLPSPRPEAVTVAAGAAKIKVLPRHGQHTGHLPFADLAVDMLVTVSWHGRIRDRTVDADKVDIRCNTGRFHRDVRGRIVSVVATPVDPVLLVELGLPMFLNGQPTTRVELHLDGETSLFRETMGGTARIAVADLRVGEPLWASALARDGRLEADTVVVAGPGQ